jgi:hypothetical protein
MATADELLDVSVEVHVTVRPADWGGADDADISAEIAGRTENVLRNSDDLRNVIQEFGGVEITYEERRP